MLPLLRITGDGVEHKLDECVDNLANEFNLSPDDRKEFLPSGKQTVFENRVGWARTYLKKAGLLESPARGRFKITERGQQVLRSNPRQIDPKFLEQFPEFVAFKTIQRTPNTEGAAKNQESDSEGSRTPEEIMDATSQALRRALAQDLLERVKMSSPRFFERLVVDLLVAMGYGGSRKEAGRAIGGKGDDGLDGVIDEDRLGLDKVYVQAKRWAGTVGRPVVQALAGSLEGRGAVKGVLITTSDFSREAREYTERIQKRIVLIDGEMLSELMIDAGVGVAAVSNYQIWKIDSDYFEGEE
ncbi:MAG TPA: restriction endonuclease [Candidatus Binataceae bacterium]|nr:restriction endonuclease [Candidatus Binataceae bacterium]